MNKHNGKGMTIALVLCVRAQVANALAGMPVAVLDGSTGKAWG